MAFQRRLGYVPEEAHLYPHLTGREYLQLVGRLRGLPRRVLEPRMDELLRLFALWDDRHSPLSSYSKGMRQKILLSGALIHNPELLIFDEPFSGLDVTTALVLRTLLHELAAQGKIIFYSSHVLEVVEKVCSSRADSAQGQSGGARRRGAPARPDASALARRHFRPAHRAGRSRRHGRAESSRPSNHERQLAARKSRGDWMEEEPRHRLRAAPPLLPPLLR